MHAEWTVCRANGGIQAVVVFNIGGGNASVVRSIVFPSYWHARAWARRQVSWARNLPTSR